MQVGARAKINHLCDFEVSISCPKFLSLNSVEKLKSFCFKSFSLEKMATSLNTLRTDSTRILLKHEQTSEICITTGFLAIRIEVMTDERTTMVT